MKIMVASIVMVVFLFAVVGLLFLDNFVKNSFSGDSWIQDERGVWIRQGYPHSVPDFVLEQQATIACALTLFNDRKDSGMDFVSQCLGSCGDYVVDIVHVPREVEDNLPENQCEDYLSGKFTKFVELDREGKIIRIK